MWKSTDRPVVVAGLAAALILSACSGAASPSTSPGPATGSPAPERTPNPSSTAPTGRIDHPTGATELVLRFGEGGGFVMPAFAMMQLPWFSLYGDGTVIYRAASEPFPEVKEGEPMRMPRARIARMSEEQVQALLRDALGDAGLAVARPSYENQMVADASTSIFTVNADGRQKTVRAYALGFDAGDPNNPNPDAQILAAMAAFAERLRNFDQEIAAGGATEVGVFTPDRFRASLIEDSFSQGPARDWPWPLFGPEAFTTAEGASEFGFPSKVLSPVEVSLLGVENPEGGVSGILLRGPNGKVYSLGLRPLLPDELR